MAIPAKQQVYRDNYRERGGIYILVLMVCMIVTAIGLSSLLAERVQWRSSDGLNDVSSARLYAESAVDITLLKLKQDSNWRQTYTHNAWVSQQNIGHGTFKWKLMAVGSTDLQSPANGPVEVIAWGMTGQATQKVSVRLVPEPGPGLDVLTAATYAMGDIGTSSTVTAVNGPFVTEGTFTNGNTTIGDVEAAAVVNAAGITGNITVPTTPKMMPSSSVFDTYQAMANVIPFASIPFGTIDGEVLSPASNPYGSPNTAGVYHVVVPAGNMLIIRQCRLVATLVITLESGAKFRTSTANFWQTPPEGSPLLIVKSVASATIDLDGFINPLSESDLAINFNPPGTPYNGEWDNDIIDEYPSQIQGLIHVIGSLVTTNLGSNVEVIGTVITEGPMTLGSNASVTADANLTANPPDGYTEVGPGMQLVTASWRMAVD